MTQEEDYYFDGFTEEEIEEMKSFNYNEAGIDNAIEECKELNDDISRLQDLFKQRVEKLQYEVDVKIAKLQKKKDWHLNNIKEFAKNSTNKRELKTQWKIPMISGDIVIKKAQEKFVNKLENTNKTNEAIIIAKLPEYKKEKAVVTLDWAGMKANLEIRVVDGAKVVWDTNLKKDVSEFVSIEKTPEEVVIQ